MNVSVALEHHRNFHAANSKPSTQRGYGHFYNTFSREFGERELSEVTPDEILSYLTRLTAKCNKETRRLRYVQTKAFFNFCINCLEVDIQNPCNNKLLSNSFRLPRRAKRTVIGNDYVSYCTSFT